VSDGRPAGEPLVLRKGLEDVGLMDFTRDGSFFYGVRNQESDPYVVGMDPVTHDITGQPLRLSDDHQGSNHAPVWSPDGNRVVFVRGPRTASQLVIRERDGHERTLPTPIHDGWSASRHGVRWFPDNRSILLLDWVDGRKPFRKVDVETGTSSTVYDASSDTWVAPALSPDGRYLFYSEWDHSRSVNETSALRLNRREIATGQTVTLHEWQSDGIGAFGLCVSPDGQRLAFSVNAEPPVRLLMTIPTAGGAPRVLFRGSYENPVPSAMAWTRDGKAILFSAVASARTGPRTEALWSVPAVGGSPRRLGLTMPSLISLAPSPNGERLAFLSERRYPEIWVIHNLLAGRPQELKWP
jgi:Tol biopolymer transport system component